MKLISMTEFVLEQEKIDTIENLPCETDKYFNKCVDYAKFLKEPLKLEMFVPCSSENGLPLCLDGLINSDGIIIDEIEYQEYKQAKEKVLFEGFEIRDIMNNQCLFNDKENKSFGWFEKKEFIFFNEYKKIEDLVKHNLTLTPNAEKLIK